MSARSREEQEELEAGGLIEDTATTTTTTTTTDSVSDQLATPPGPSTQAGAASDSAQAGVTSIGQTATTGINYSAAPAPLSRHPILRSWASHSSLGDVPSPVKHYGSGFPQEEVASSDQTENMDVDDEAAHTPKRDSFEGNAIQQATAPPEPLLTLQWRLAGRPPCPECRGFHPPPCIPSLARVRHADIAWEAQDPRGFKSHKRWRERKPRERYGLYPPVTSPVRSALHRAPQDPTSDTSGLHVESTQSSPVENTPSTPIVSDPTSDIVPAATLEPGQAAMERMLRVTADPMSLEELQDLLFDPRIENLPGAPEIILEIIQERTIDNEVAWEDAPQDAWEDASQAAWEEAYPDASQDATEHEPDDVSGDASQDVSEDASEAAAGPSTSFRTGSERALNRDLVSGQGQSANAAGKQSKR